MSPNEANAFAELLKTTAEYYGKKITAATVQLWWNALHGMALEQVRGAFNLHVQTNKFMPTISEILDAVRTQDGRPEPEEAWSMVARCLNDEGVTVVWTDEMACAFGIALGLQATPIAARMAFLESYRERTAVARRSGTPVHWCAALGHDQYGREGPVVQAVKMGRLTAQHAVAILPCLDQPSPQIQALMGTLEKPRLSRQTTKELAA